MTSLSEPCPPPGERPVLRELAIFYGLALTLTVLATALMWRLPPDFVTGDVSAIRQAVKRVATLAEYIPAVTAVVCTLAFAGGGGLISLLRRVVEVRISPVYYLIALAAPVAPQWIAALIWAEVTGIPLSYPDPVVFFTYWAQITLFGAMMLLSEEIGWRGFLLPRLLVRMRWRKAAIVSGGLWALWHFPFWAPANYAATGSAFDTVITLLFAALGATALSVIITWLFIRTRYSVALAVFLHGSGNASMGQVYGMLGDEAGGHAWPLVYNGVLIATAAVFFMLPQQQCTVRGPEPHNADFRLLK